MILWLVLATGVTSDEWVRLAAAGGLGGLLLEGFRTIRDHKKSDATVAETITKAATVLLDPLTKANVTLTKERDAAVLRARALQDLLENCQQHLRESRRNSSGTD